MIKEVPENGHEPTISLCMIVKDEEKYLDDCLSSVQGCVDEIVIVDTGSTDGTVDIARRFGARVYHLYRTVPRIDRKHGPLACSVLSASPPHLMCVDFHTVCAIIPPNG